MVVTLKLDNREGKKCPMKPIEFLGKIRELLRLEIHKIRSRRRLSRTTWIILPGVQGNGLHDATWTILALQLSDVQVPSQRSRQWECKLSTSSSCFFRPDLCVCSNVFQCSKRRVCSYRVPCVEESQSTVIRKQLV